MSTPDDDLDGVPRSKSISVAVDMNGVTVYMTRAAIRDLIAELHRISEAEPKECFEVHLNMHFRHWGETDDGPEYPGVRFSDGLGSIIQDCRNAALREAIEAGELTPDARLSPFEVTIMHLSPEAVREEGERSDD